jgi:hypothetical protein
LKKQNILFLKINRPFFKTNNKMANCAILENTLRELLSSPDKNIIVSFDSQGVRSVKEYISYADLKPSIERKKLRKAHDVPPMTPEEEDMEEALRQSEKIGRWKVIVLASNIQIINLDNTITTAQYGQSISFRDGSTMMFYAPGSRSGTGAEASNSPTAPFDSNNQCNLSCIRWNIVPVRRPDSTTSQ